MQTIDLLQCNFLKHLLWIKDPIVIACEIVQFDLNSRRTQIHSMRCLTLIASQSSGKFLFVQIRINEFYDSMTKGEICDLRRFKSLAMIWLRRLFQPDPRKSRERMTQSRISFIAKKVISKLTKQSSMHRGENIFKSIPNTVGPCTPLAKSSIPKQDNFVRARNS